MNLNSKHALKVHGELITKKWFLNELYSDFYRELKSIKVPKGKRVEIGSGAGFIKKIIPSTITSDVVEGKGIDMVFSSTKITFKDNEVSAYYMLNVLHHIKEPDLALKEMQRSLKKGGKIVMIEPYISLWGNFIYKNFHHEYLNPKSNWKIMGKGRMSDANTAMPWIIFVRDKQKFQREFRNLKIVKIKPHTPFRYLASGGLSKPQLLPNFAYKILKKFEEIISPLNNFLGMFVTIELEKT